MAKIRSVEYEAVLWDFSHRASLTANLTSKPTGYLIAPSDDVMSERDLKSVALDSAASRTGVKDPETEIDARLRWKV